MHFTSATALVGALALGQVACAAGFYHKSSPVMNVGASDFDKKIKFHNRPSIVEFYAPWCGHCQSLKPAYEKAAKALDGLVNVAAVNCDDEENKAFCGTMGIKGFPTLKTVRQTGMYGKPIMMDYHGGRTAPDLVEAGKNLIPNVVEKLDDKNYEEFLDEDKNLPRAILFTEKGTTAALIKALAHEYVTNLKFGQVRSKEKGANGKFKVDKYPTLIVLPGGEDEPVVYEGKLEKAPMNEFLDKYADRYDAKAAMKASKAAAKGKKVDEEDEGPTIRLEMPDPTGSPDPEAGGPPPVAVPDVTPPIPTLATQEELVAACLGLKTSTCVVALLPAAGGDSPAEQPEDALAALHSLSELAKKHKVRSNNLFPFYALPADNPGAAQLKAALGLEDGDVQLVALNGKRSWWNQHAADKGFGDKAVEDWIDSIRFGEAKKTRMPEGLVLAEEKAKEPIEHIEL